MRWVLVCAIKESGSGQINTSEDSPSSGFPTKNKLTKKVMDAMALILTLLLCYAMLCKLVLITTLCVNTRPLYLRLDFLSVLSHVVPVWCAKKKQKNFPKDSRQVTQIPPSCLPRHICCNKSGDASSKVTNVILLFLKTFALNSNICRIL